MSLTGSGTTANLTSLTLRNNTADADGSSADYGHALYVYSDVPTAAVAIHHLTVERQHSLPGSLIHVKGDDDPLAWHCPPGEYGDASADVDIDLHDTCPLNCSAGYYGNSTEPYPAPYDGSCSGVCPRGHRCPEGTGAPLPCEEGTFASDAGSAVCSDCTAECGDGVAIVSECTATNDLMCAVPPA